MIKNYQNLQIVILLQCIANKSKNEGQIYLNEYKWQKSTITTMYYVMKEDLFYCADGYEVKICVH